MGPIFLFCTIEGKRRGEGREEGREEREGGGREEGRKEREGGGEEREGGRGREEGRRGRRGKRGREVERKKGRQTHMLTLKGYRMEARMLTCSTRLNRIIAIILRAKNCFMGMSTRPNVPVPVSVGGCAGWCVRLSVWVGVCGMVSA